MAEVMPINFPLPSESAVASYSYSDLAEGTGVTMFYLLATNGDNILSQNQIYSDVIEYSTSAHALTTDFVKNLDVDFDLTAFNAPRTVKGTAYTNFTFHQWKSGTQVVTSKFTIKVRKWDGVTETEIGNATTAEITDTDGYKLTALAIPLTETNFGIGDVLRVTVEGWDKEAAADSTNVLTFGQDPMNRDGHYIIPSTDNPVSTTQFKIWIPFKIDL